MDKAYRKPTDFDHVAMKARMHEMRRQSVNVYEKVLVFIIDFKVTVV